MLMLTFSNLVYLVILCFNAIIPGKSVSFTGFPCEMMANLTRKQRAGLRRRRPKKARLMVTMGEDLLAYCTRSAVTLGTTVSHRGVPIVYRHHAANMVSLPSLDDINSA